LIEQHGFSKVARVAGREFTLKRFEASDIDAAINFFNRLPVEERDHLWNDPSDKSIIVGWTRPTSVSRIIPIAVLEGSKIISIWTLGFGEHGWTRHLGYVWGIVDPAYRRAGVATIVVHELLRMANELEMERVVIELVTQQKGPITHFTNVGFTKAATLHEWVKDRRGNYHDLVVLTMELEPAWRKMEEMLASYDSHAN
jgi:RimJ/RimL family protein N-acetyltransferase